MKITITKEDLENSVEKGIISGEQAQDLWANFSEKYQHKIGFSGLNVTYYFGALIIISAMTWFATEAFATYNSVGLLVVGLLYFGGLFVFGKKLYAVHQTQIPGGLLLTAAVFMVPLIVFSIQDYFSVWGYEAPGNYREFYIWIKSGWFVMEVATITTAIIFLIKYDFPFITFPLAFSLWFLSMDLTPIIFGVDEFTWEQRKVVSLIFGLAMLIFTFFIDRRTKKDYAFWLYLFGMLCFWGGLSSMDSNSELNRFIYFSINLLLIAISVLLNRKLFIVFGALGVYGYLFHLSEIVFKDSLLFPVALSFFGISIIWLGIRYNKNKEKIDGFINSKLPAGFLKSLPPNRV